MKEITATDKAHHRRGTLPICLLLSLLVHGGLVALLVLTLPHAATSAKPGGNSKKYTLTLTRPQNKEQQEAPAQEKNKPFIKTDSERPQIKPKDADFEGARDAQAEGMDITNRQNDSPAPTMEGEVKEERNVLEQKRQDGDVQHEGKITQETTQPSAPEQNETESSDTSSPPQQEPIPAAEQHLDTPQTKTEKSEQEQARELETTETAPVTPESPEHEQATEQTPPPASPPKASLYPQHNAKRRPVYDPSQAPHAQPPGLRTEEKRSRSTGRFVIGKRPSWDVEATPRGEYESHVYRLIASKWYFACDRHRGDITPGTLIILLRLDTKGRIVDMKRVSKRGAGILQESFTFNAIRQAQFPPMPPEVIKTLIGEQMEFFITFDFN